MTGSIISKPWNNHPYPGDAAYLFSGNVQYNGNVPAGSLTIWSQGAIPTSMTFGDGPRGVNPYGSLASGFMLRTADTGGAGVNLAFRNLYPGLVANTYYNDGMIDDMAGTLRFGLQTRFENDGLIHAHPGTEFDIATNGFAFNNDGMMGAFGYPGTGWSNLKVTIAMNYAGNPALDNVGLYNYGTIEAAGAHTQVGITSEASGYNLNHGGILNNAGMIRSSPGGAIFLDAPVTGTGRMQTNGGVIKIDNSISTGQTIDITSGSLEFGPPFALQFLVKGETPTITNMTAASTILLDGVFGTSLAETVSTQITDLKVFDTHSIEIADLHFAGAMSGTFQVESHHQFGGPMNDYTAIIFHPALFTH